MSDLFIIDSRMTESTSVNFYNQNEVKVEPMLFSASLDFAKSNGGPITRDFLSKLNPEWLDHPELIIDSRMHMLMPGFYPCIPGYHHDDVPRERSDGQPNYINPSYRSKHCLCIVGGGSRTKFALGRVPFPDVPIGKKYYKEWHPLVQEYLEFNLLKRYDAPFGRLVYFDDRTWHAGTPAYETQFRFFIRASIDTKRIHTNEIRTQTQVYLENPMEGW